MRPTHISRRLRWTRVIAAAGFVTTLLVAASPFSPRAAAAGLSSSAAAFAGPAAATPTPARATAPAKPAPSGATAPAGAGQNPLALSIDVTDGTNTAKPGDVLSYTVNIRNIGSASTPLLDVALMLPPAFKLLSATGNGTRGAGQVKWRVSLPAGRSGTFRVVGRVGRTPGQLLRLDAIACAMTGKGVKPIVCAASSDELPAGIAAAARTRAIAAPSADHVIRYVLVAAAALVLVLALGGLAMITRRRLVTTKHARSSR